MNAIASRAAAPSGRARHGMRGVNPVARLAAALVISLTLVLSLDVVSVAVALAAELMLMPLVGVAMRTVILRCTPLLVAAPLAAATTVLYGEDSGAVYADWGMITITHGSVTLGIAIALRVLAIGLPTVVLLVGIDPTDLADGLAQVAHLPSRFVLGALAGLRMVGLFIEDWRGLALARRARGIGDGGGPVAAVWRGGSQAFALLVLAVRRGSVLATAMEARGFGSSATRSWARPSRLHRRDAVLFVVAASVAGVAVATAVLVGSWNFVLS